MKINHGQGIHDKQFKCEQCEFATDYRSTFNFYVNTRVIFGIAVTYDLKNMICNIYCLCDLI